jgi:hypothetical protein
MAVLIGAQINLVSTVGDRNSIRNSDLERCVTPERKPTRFQGYLPPLKSHGVVLHHKIINIPAYCIQLRGPLKIGMP